MDTNFEIVARALGASRQKTSEETSARVASIAGHILGGGAYSHQHVLSLAGSALTQARDNAELRAEIAQLRAQQTQPQGMGMLRARRLNLPLGLPEVRKMGR